MSSNRDIVVGFKKPVRHWINAAALKPDLPYESEGGQTNQEKVSIEFMFSRFSFVCSTKLQAHSRVLRFRGAKFIFRRAKVLFLF